MEKKKIMFLCSSPFFFKVMSSESLIELNSDPTNVPTKKNAGKSKWFGWGTHIIQGEEISPSH
jgi:hypothetical protein